MNRRLPDEPLWDREATLARLGGDAELLAEMIGFYREDSPQLIERCDRAFAAGDLPAAARAAHAIRGLAATFDGRQVMQAATDLEERCRAGDVNGAAAGLAAARSTSEALADRLAEYLGSSERLEPS
ncbi:MAG TPA: Hpt domain-containing protein [Pirellulaceae bacterium]|nr:Hpt domain-containing protein [Pirellulaceae bacterium]